MATFKTLKRHVLYALSIVLITSTGCAVPVYTYQPDAYVAYSYPVISYEYIPYYIYFYPYYRYYYPPFYVDIRIRDHKHYYKDHRGDRHHPPKDRRH